MSFVRTSRAVAASTPQEAAERFHGETVKIATIFANIAKSMNPSPLSDTRMFLLTQADTHVRGEDAVKLVTSFVAKLQELHASRPEAVTARKNRELSFIIANEDILIPMEVMRGIVSDCLSRKKEDGSKYVDDSIITTVWMLLQSIIVKASNFVKLSPETYPDGDIIKRTWLM